MVYVLEITWLLIIYVIDFDDQCPEDRLVKLL